MNVEAMQALEKLRAGNRAYLNAARGGGDISPAIRKKTSEEGQHPYAVIVACSDSRVIPEAIFSAGIGELFVIRVAGNVVDRHQLGSIEYAVFHLGAQLVVVLGHTRCGAVGAALKNGGEGYIRSITDEIKYAIGGEGDEIRACMNNAKRSAEKIRFALRSYAQMHVVSALYRVEDGAVDFAD